MEHHRPRYRGPAAEKEASTRAACTKFASETLKIEDADAISLAACHRLSRKKDAGIIVRFNDLADRDKWMAGTQNLKGLDKRYSVCPDLPPVLRKLKDELMLERKQLSPELKNKARVRYVQKWPFVELRIEGRPTQRPKIPKTAITESVIGFDPLFKVLESTED